MSNQQLRKLIRGIHLTASIMIIGLVYSEALRATPGFILLMQVVVIPVVFVSGMAMWQQAAISKLRRKLSKTQSTEPGLA